MGTAALKFTKVSWTDQAAAQLATIDGAAGNNVDHWRHYVTNGTMNLVAVTLDGVTQGFVVWCIEHEPTRRAIVINAAAIAPIKGLCMTSTIFDFANAMAAQNGASVVRFWTKRRGLVRKMQPRMETTYVMETTL